jgi:hypothetical protein
VGTAVGVARSTFGLRGAGLILSVISSPLRLSFNLNFFPSLGSRIFALTLSFSALKESPSSDSRRSPTWTPACSAALPTSIYKTWIFSSTTTPNSSEGISTSAGIRTAAIDVTLSDKLEPLATSADWVDDCPQAASVTTKLSRTHTNCVTFGSI